MITVQRMLAKGRDRADRARARLMAAGAALATLLLCTAVGLVDGRDEWGSLTGLALALLVVPVVALLHQANRLADLTRERRLAALRLAGATPGEVRLLGALESGWLGLLGALTGAAAYVLAQLTGVLAAFRELVVGAPAVSGELAAHREPIWGGAWSTPAVTVPVVVAVVVLSGLLSGALAGRHVVASPLGVVRRVRPRGARASDVLLIAGGVCLLAAAAVTPIRRILAVFGIYGIAAGMAVGMVMLLFGLTLATARLIRAVAARSARRGRTPETLLAARLVEADPRGWARAMSVVGLAVFFGAASGAQQSVVGYGRPHLFIDLALLIALATAAAALVVRQAESLLDHQRSFAALAAAGVEEKALRRVMARQAALAAAPVCVVAAVAGVAVVLVPTMEIQQSGYLVWTSARAVAMAGIGVLAAILVALAARALLRAAIHPDRLRARQ
ncbi:hypothetical protein [Nonomuraea typhae]|uniref:FtsX-like permease family protein n=1 Tax=Nonomuraea typhae TaxID=2603600 RepID=A0ABW7Z225_9ACTN